jgi:hypothetical protein
MGSRWEASPIRTWSQETCSSRWANTKSGGESTGLLVQPDYVAAGAVDERVPGSLGIVALVLEIEWPEASIRRRTKPVCQ